MQKISIFTLKPIYNKKMSITINMCVESYDVQPNGNIKISSLLKMLQKAAGDDVNRTNLDYFTLASHSIAFVLTKMTVKIIKDIKIYDELTIISHPRKVRGASFPRDFLVYAGSELCAVARSIWVLLDLDNRTILRPSAISEIGDIPPSEDDSFEISDVRRVVDENSLPRTNVLRVEYSHLDMNNHLNNTFYSDFVFNCISPDVHKSDVGLYLQINYKTEARLGDELEIFLAEGDNCYDFLAKNKDSDKVCFTAYLSFCKD